MSTQQTLFSAIEEGRIETVRELLSADSTLVDARNEAGLSAVLLATYHGRNDIARLLIDRGARLDIFEAAATGTQDRVEQLLQKEAALKNSWSPDGWTPIHLAVFFGRVNIAHFLLSKGADLNAVSRTNEHVSPLHSALANPNNAAIAQLLIEHGADINARQAQGYTPLHYAATYGLESIVRALLQRSANRTARNADGKTAFDLASEKGYTAVAELLKPR